MSFLINSFLLGVGLAMDAFSVSLANGLNEPRMKKSRMNLMAGTFGVFQFLMPLIGWFCVHTILNLFNQLEQFIPWIALILLAYIGGKMAWEGFHDQGEENIKEPVSFWNLMVQGIATSVDALSVGFTIAEYGFSKALFACLIIGVVTYFICIIGLALGKKFGTKLAGKASIFGGILLIAIGLEILISSFF